MSVSLAPTFGAGYQSFTALGLPNAAGSIYTYAAGTSTPLATYTDSTGGMPNSDPITLGTDGKPPSEIWLTDGLAYKFVIKDVFGSTLPNSTYDNISGGITSTALAASSGSALIGFIAAYTGAILRTLQDKGRDIVCDFDFMNAEQIADVKANTATLDVTTACQNAINSGRQVYGPGGTRKLTNALTMSTSGQLYVGDGKSATIFYIGGSFSLAAAAVFNFTSAEPGPELRDLGVTCVQPDTAVRGNLTQYPPIVLATAVPRFVVRNCKFINAWNGISMTGNSGGATIDGLELFSYNTGIDIDGSLDSVRINRLHWYNFNATANQITCFYNSANIGIKSGRCDDFHLQDSLFIGGQGVNFYTSGSGSTFGNIANTDFDTNNGILMSGGTVSMAGVFFSCATAGIQAIKMTGGSLHWAAGEAQAAVALTNPMIELAGAGGNPVLQMGTIILKSTQDMTAIKVVASSGQANATVLGCRFENTANTSPAKPVVYAASGRLTFQGNEISDKGTGTGTFVQLDADDFHNVTNNKFVGWGITHVSPQVNAVIYGNNGVDGWITSFTPTVTTSVAGPPTYSANCRYKQIGKTIHVWIQTTLTALGGGSGVLNITVPVAPNLPAGGVNFVAGEAAVTGKSLRAYLPTSTTTISVNNYDNTSAVVLNSNISLSATYPVA